MCVGFLFPHSTTIKTLLLPSNFFLINSFLILHINIMNFLHHNLASSRALTLWKSCLASAFRTTVACAIVGGATLYGPAALRRVVAYPAFSYVTVILIITDATLGDTFRGCWLAIYATVQAVCPAFLLLWALVAGNILTAATTAAAVAVGAFVVVLPESTDLVAKRIGLGQVVIVYVLGFIDGVDSREIVMHLVHVVASTAIGVLACVLALLLPYPRLAYYEVKQSCKNFAENASERVNLLVKSFCEEDEASALAMISQSKSMSVKGRKLLQNITSKQGSMHWERLAIKFLKPAYFLNPAQQQLQDLETPIKGMEIALSNINSHSFPVKFLNQELKDDIYSLENHITIIFTHLQYSMPLDLATVQESNKNSLTKPLLTVEPPSQPKDLPSFFFLFCFKLLQKNLLTTTPNSSTLQNPPTTSSNSRKPAKISVTQGICYIWSNIKGTLISHKRLKQAFKCSLALFLSVLFGLIYSKENGVWSGLPVAISFAAQREATFRVANIKAQGTVLGTVYGVLGCYVFEKYVKVRFISLLPWFIFTGFLRRSRMYGQAGGISAVIGAVLILGRTNFGTPSEFAIARIVETVIGLSCSILVDVVFGPKRASTLAKIQLSKSLKSVHECVETLSLTNCNISNVKERQNKLKVDVNKLSKFIGEAEVEPNFWYLPFNGSCYGKLLGSLSKIVDVCLFGIHAIGLIEKELIKADGSVCGRSVLVSQLDGDIKVFKEMIGSSMKCFEKISLIESLERKVSIDLELGKSQIPMMLRLSGSEIEAEVEKMTNSFLKYLREIMNKVFVSEYEEEMKSQLVLGLSTLGYCLTSLVVETRDIEKAILELIQWENPSSNVNLLDIYCKLLA